ncbi:MAG TPA: galactokinase family protein [Pyrinomonadaceae bacterium]|nr:galactokinase family protein [Pyrinomonadaceae bacterium]
MYRVLQGNASQEPDVQPFINLLNNLDTNHFSPANGLFDTNADLIVARAPGRLDVMGGIADYSGSHVLEYPIAEATLVAVQLNTSRTLKIVTLIENEPGRSFTMKLSDFDGPVEYEAAREFFQRERGNRWAAYVAGVFLVLMRELHASFASGANILISTRVPPGKGVSSSAALEVAVMTAVTKAFDLAIEGRDTALLCQKVENLVVGAPCGVMDQMTAVFGERDRLLLLLCQPAEIKRMIKLPARLRLWGLDSGIRHSVVGADYGSVRAATFAGLQTISDLRPQTRYLANISPSELENEYLAQLPESLRTSTSHPIYENARVQRFVELLDHPEPLLNELGELMYESHRSYTALGLNSSGTDRLVDLVRKEGPDAGLFGAKITGGGSGGTVAVLGDQTSRTAVERVAASYFNETGHRPYIFTGSSRGSLAFGHLLVRPQVD